MNQIMFWTFFLPSLHNVYNCVIVRIILHLTTWTTSSISRVLRILYYFYVFERKSWARGLYSNDFANIFNISGRKMMTAWNELLNSSFRKCVARTTSYRPFCTASALCYMFYQKAWWCQTIPRLMCRLSPKVQNLALSARAIWEHNEATNGSKWTNRAIIYDHQILKSLYEK